MLRHVLVAALSAGVLAFVPSAHAEPRVELRQARTAVASIARHAALIQTELRVARTRGDRARARCLSGKLSQLHAQERLAGERRDDLGWALARGDAAAIRTERSVLSALQLRARELAREARSCGRFGPIPEDGTFVRVIAD